jgi:hypothetical protein
MKAPKCRTHNVCYCHCLWTPGQRAAAGIASMPFAMDSAPVALDALSDDEMDMIRAAMKSARPTARRAQVAQDEQLRDATGRPVDHDFLTFGPQQIVTKPLKYSKYVYDGN